VGAEAAAAALTPEPPASLWPDRADAGTSQVCPTESRDAGSGDATPADAEGVGAGKRGSLNGGSGSVGTDGSSSSETDALQDAKAEVSAAQADRATDRDAAVANEAPGVDQARQSTEDAVRNAGTKARLDAIANGASPQEAVVAEQTALRQERAKGGNPLGKAAGVIGNLDRALNKMQDDE